MPVLTAIDVLGVQRFIFSSNRLRDAVAGSYLVHWSTSRDGALEGLVPKEKILLAGGGNAIVEFDSAEKARKFAAYYSRSLYDNAYGLEAAIAHQSFEPGGLAQALQNIQTELARQKVERVPAAPLLGLSVTASCQETGQPATGFDTDTKFDTDTNEPPVPLSRDVLNRRGVNEEANAHWSEYLINKDGFNFPMEMDHLGRTMGDTSQIGVVHVDGNGVGKKIASWLSRKIEDQADDDTVRREYREWSRAIDELGKEAFQTVTDRIWRAIKKEITEGKEKATVKGKQTDLSFELKRHEGKWMLPLRPILLGGDDLTFVCDGRIALDLAETALAVFEGSDVPHLGKITACAGVAITRVHAPFTRAYELAGKLCDNAKALVKQKDISSCALDWHIGLSRPGESLSEIRKRQYCANGYQLTCRPYLVGASAGDTETWRWLTQALLDDPVRGLRGAPWSERRNKAKALAEMVREGPAGVMKAFNTWHVVDKNLDLPHDLENGFFDESRSPLLDALEILDLHMVLEPQYSEPKGEA